MTPMIAEIKAFAGNYTPENFMSCNGQELQKTDYPLLFAVLGTTYGGDGTTTFKLPNLNGKTLVGIGQVPGSSNMLSIGVTGGAESVTINTANLPEHNHAINLSTTVPASSGNASISSPNDGATLATPGVQEGRTFTSTFGYNNEVPDINLTGTDIEGNTSDVGGGEAIEVMQPYLAINYVICVNGYYPKSV